MKKIATVSTFIALAALLFAGGVLAATLFTRPLAEPLDVAVKPAEVVQEQPVQPVEPVQPAEPAAPAVVQQAAEQPIPAPEGVCGLNGSMNVLFTGADFSPGVWPYGADAVRLVRLDFDNQTISVVAFPRDLWLKTEALKDPNRMNERLGLSYHYKKQSTTGSEREKVTAATSLVAQVLYDNFQVLPDHYVTVQLSSVQAMVDTVGGVEINLQSGFTSDGGVVFPTGTQTLDGRLSAEFLRTYNPGGDAARLKRQNLYVKALRTRMLDAGLIVKLPELFNQFNEAVVTDLSPKQITELACVLEQIPGENIKFYEIEGEMVTAQKDGALLPIWDKIKPMLEEVLGTKLN